MLKMSEKSKRFLEKNIPQLLGVNDLNMFLDKLDDFITSYGLDDQDNMTAFGHEAQYVYDEVYCCNE